MTTPPSTTPTGTVTGAATANTATTTKTTKQRKALKKVYHFKKIIKSANGHAYLRGLPVGKARITIRKAGKVIARKSVTIMPHTTQTIVVQLHGKKVASK